MTRTSFLALVMLSLAIAPSVATSQTLLHYDFEQVALSAPAFGGWQTFGAQTSAVTESFGFQGARSARIDGSGLGEDQFTSYSLLAPLETLAGHGVVLRGAIRTEDVSRSSGLWLRVDGPNGPTSFDNMSDTGPSGTTEWTEFELRAEVPETATGIVFGIMQRGSGLTWVDDIRVEVDSTVVAEEAEAAIPLPAATELPEPDRTLPDENPEWVAHAARTGFPLSSIEAGSFDDLDFLPEVIGDKRVVQLGESGHGVAEFNQAKTRLIKYLHQEMGFDVLAFESSLHGCYEADRRMPELTAADLMTSCIFGVWNTEEVIELFEYVVDTHQTDRPLRIAGFDTQNSSRVGPEWRAEFWRETLASIAPTYAEEIVALEGRMFASFGQPDTVAAYRDEWVESYRDLERMLTEVDGELSRVHADSPETPALARRLAVSTIHLIDQYAAEAGVDRTIARDSGMADNLDFVLDTLYPDDKVIVWGHNFHIRHDNESVSPNPVKTMGQWLAERRRDDLYTVGLYMRHGRAAMNNRQVYNVLPPGSGDLESILGHVGEPYLFLDLATTGADPAGSWVRESIVTKTWGQADVSMVLVDQYDAILFIDEVSPPVYR